MLDNKLKFYIIGLLFFFITGLSAQNIDLKLPIESSSFTTDISEVIFLWEDNNSSTWNIDLASNSSFIGATSFTSSNNIFPVLISSLPSQQYFWRIRSSSDTSNIQTFTIFDLNTLGNLVYHIHAQTGITNSGGNVSQWNNQANALYVATQNNITLQPEVSNNYLNGNDMVKFGGSNGSISSNLALPDFLISDTNFTFISSTQQISLNSSLSYVLGATNPNNGLFSGGTSGGGRNFGLLSNSGSGNSSIRVTGTTSLDFEIRSGIYNKLIINSIDQPVVSGGLIEQFKFTNIGVRPDVPSLNFHGYLGDIIIFNEVLSDSSRLLVENYLKTKYTPYPDLGSDTVVCGPQIKIGFRTDHAYSSRVWSTGDTNVDSITITQNGTYWVEVESFGWTIRDTIEITGIVPPPQLSISNDQILCYGDSLQIDYTILPGFSPSWYNGQTSNSIFVKDSSQFVQVTHTDVNNCFASSGLYFIAIDSLKLLSTLGNDRNICDGGNIFVETTSNQGPFEYLWNTGDTSSFTNTPTTGVQAISIEMTDFNNCIFKDTVLINAINLPAPNVDFAFDTVCPFTPNSFLDLSSPGGTDNIIYWEWDFSNLDTFFTQNPQYSFSPGVFNVALTVETDSGCSNTITKLVRTHKQPVANIEQVVICAQGPGIADNNSSIAIPDFITNYDWIIDGSSYSGNSPNVDIQNEGFVDFFLQVTTDKGCIDTTTRQIEVFPALLPDFEASNICIGDSTQFTDLTSSFSIVDRLWDFGIVGANSSDENPKYLYNTTDSFTVELSLINAIGCTNTLSKTIEIHELPIAFAIADSSCKNEEALFLDASSVSNGFVSEMSWQIASSTFSGDSIAYSFDSVATYSYFHSIIDNFGCYDDTTLDLTINPLPFVDFSFSPSYGTAPLTVDFTNLSNNTSSYLWDFNDGGATSNLENPDHTFNENGSYAINLFAFNSFGCNSSLNKTLSISPTELDLELTTLSFQKTNLVDGSIAYSPSVLLKNVGSRLIQNVDLYASVDMETKIAETWTGNLEIGQSLLYTFSSYFVVSNENALEYFCLEGKNVNDNTEENLLNNKVCLIQNGLIQTSELYPNPTINKAFLDIVSKSNSTIKIEVYDMLGKKIIENNGIEVNKGFNQYVLDCENILAGTYYLNIVHQDEIYTHKLIISNP